MSLKVKFHYSALKEGRAVIIDRPSLVVLRLSISKKQCKIAAVELIWYSL
jgi:hypothetical protein